MRVDIVAKTKFNTFQHLPPKVRIENIIDKVTQHNPDADTDLIVRAYFLSAKMHRDQKRRSGEPYLIHPLETAYILADMGLDQVTVVVGLLHDVLEDTLMTKEELEKTFGKEVANIVEGVTKISQIPFTSLEEKQAENFRKMLIAMVDDIRVILVKLADRLHNMNTLEHMPRDKQVKIATETMEIYIPIAHRLGMGAIKSQLEDLCFKYTNPEAFKQISDKIESDLPVNEAIILDVMKRMQTAMDENNIISTIEFRIKGIMSISRKAARIEKLENVNYDFHDYIAFRIITKEIPDCYAALGILHTLWTPVPGQFDDYIANPKPNNYQSLHTVLIEKTHRFEVQIRTEEMHKIAEIGIAAHWRYKEGGKTGGESWMDQYYEWLRYLLEWQKEVEDPREFLQSLKADLLPDEIYTFTPKGKLFALPRGAYPLDFAYRIHTDVGNTCVGAKVNGNIVSLDTRLQSGDTVEILTNKNAKPSQDWLNLVITGRAKNKIRQYITRKERIRSIELGTKMLEKELHHRNLSLKRIKSHEAFEEILKEMGASSLDDVLSSIGFGKVSQRGFVNRFFPDLEPVGEEEEALGGITRKLKRSLGLGERGIKVKGAEDILTYLAPCCAPVLGEPIVGYITRGKGVAVHRIDCSNIAKMSNERKIDVEWATAAGGVMPVHLMITAEDAQGLLARLMNRLDKAGVNLRGISASTRVDSVAEISMTLEVKDIKHLNTIIKSLRDVRGVLDIERS